MLTNYVPDDSLCKVTLPDFDVDPDGMKPYRLLSDFRDKIYGKDLMPPTNTTTSLEDNDKTKLPTNNRQRQGPRNPTRRIKYIPHLILEMNLIESETKDSSLLWFHWLVMVLKPLSPASKIRNYLKE